MYGMCCFKFEGRSTNPRGLIQIYVVIFKEKSKYIIYMRCIWLDFQEKWFYILIYLRYFKIYCIAY